jgi:hypothetical protein
MVALEETRATPRFCEDICGQRNGYRYFGLQYGMECWCGDSYGKHGRVDPEGDTPSTGCATPCTGDRTQKCGGENINSVYEITSKYPPQQKHPDGRPLLGLVMIVKDEAHTLPNTLLALKPWIDVYYILDTGSTDGTQEAIRKTLGADKGEVWEEPFIDYGRSRNRALEIAQQTRNLGGPPVFSLMLSADETVHNAYGLRKFCEEHRDRVGSQEEAYYVQMDVGWRFDSARLSRTDKGWRYQGRVHEYLAPATGRGTPTLRVPEMYIKFKVTDESRRAEREFVILRILQEETREKPQDARASFYLARTYNVVKNHTASLREFQRRVSLGGWKEEVYESLYAIAWQKDSLHLPWHEIQQAFMDAHAYSPERAEPLYAIASHWYREKSPSLAWLFALHASSLAYPTHASLWVQADVYAWQCWFILGMTGLEVKRPEQGARALLKALEKRPGDPAMQQQLSKYRIHLGKEEMEKAECEVDQRKCRVQPGGATSPQQQQLPSFAPPVPPGRISTSDQHVVDAEKRHAPATHVDSSVPGGAGPQHEAPAAADSTDSQPTASSSSLWLYSLLSFLVVSNLILVVALRNSRALAACRPGSGHGGHKEV